MSLYSQLHAIFAPFFHGLRDDLSTHLTRIERKLDIMSATLADLDSAIAAEATQVTTLIDAVTKVDADLQAAIAKAATGQDVTAELTAIQKNTAAITSAVTAAQAADASANPVPASAPPPAATTTPSTGA